MVGLRRGRGPERAEMRDLPYLGCPCRTRKLAAEQRADVRDALLEVLIALLQDPHAVDSISVPGAHPLVRWVLVDPYDVMVSVLVSDQFRTVRLLRITDLPTDR
jgi:hypothetical protein